MAERLRRLVLWLARVLRAVGLLLWSWLGRFGRWVARSWQLLEVDRAVRARERQRREVFENLGRMVFLLFKRSLVANADLLAECEKIRNIDVEIDALYERADRIKTARPPASAGVEPDRLVAAIPAELEEAGPTTPIA